MRLLIGLIAALLAGVYLIVVIYMINKKKSERDVRNVLKTMQEEKDQMKLLYFEQMILNKLKVSEDQVRFFIYSERIIIAALFLVSFMIFGTVGLGLFACVVILILMDNRQKEEVYESGITRINDTVSFMDYFVPAINSGNSAYQAFLGYINKLDKDSLTRELLIDYRNHKSAGDLNYQTPEAIKTIVTIYENAVYNEEKGIDDYLYIIEEAKQDLFQKQQYYNDYQARMSEVIKPISWAYYVGVPLIIFMTMGSTGDFWYSIWGLVAVVLLIILFFIFKYTLMKLNMNTIKTIL